MNKAANSFVARTRKYEATVPIFVRDIPCLAGVVMYHVAKPNRRGETPEEYFGGRELAWDILDRKGYPAAWLGNMITEAETADAECIISEYMNDFREAQSEAHWESLRDR